MKTRCWASLVLSGITVAGPVCGDVPEIQPSATLQVSGAADYDAVGVSIAIDGGMLLAGGPGLGSAGGNSGGGVIFRRVADEWVPGQALIPSGAASGDEFGMAVTLDGVRAAVGGPGATTATGDEAGRVGVYTFNGTNWGETTVLSAGPGQGQAGARFGASLGLSGDVLVIGAPQHDTSIRDEGRAYVYRFQKTAWVLEAVLEAPDAGENDRFGTAVAVVGNTIAVGVPRDDDRGIDGGAVWIFERDGGDWSAVQKLVRSETDWYAGFGGSLALQGDVLAVGAYRDDLFGPDAGALRVYRRGASDWQMEAVLGGEFGESLEFGWSVAIDAGRLVCGAPASVDGGLGVIYRTPEAGIWDVEAVIVPGADARGFFGTAVAIDAGVVACGAPTASGAATYSGVATIFDLSSDCDADGVPDVIAIASGLASDQNGDGVPDDCQCTGDLFPDGVVNGADLGVYLTYASGPCGDGTENPNCIGDLDGNGVITGGDLGLLLGNWGPCGGGAP